MESKLIELWKISQELKANGFYVNLNMTSNENITIHIFKDGKSIRNEYFWFGIEETEEKYQEFIRASKSIIAKEVA